MPDNFQYTHAVLVARAEQWLSKTRNCCPVFTELSTSAAEICDAIGWNAGKSILVECKTSRGDFRADQKKHFRANPEFGVGVLRYYLTPKGLIEWDEVPANWGLLEYDGKAVREWVKPQPMASNQKDEISMLVSALRRTQKRISPMKFREFLRAAEGDPLDAMYIVRKADNMPLFKCPPVPVEAHTETCGGPDCNGNPMDCLIGHKPLATGAVQK